MSKSTLTVSIGRNVPSDRVINVPSDSVEFDYDSHISRGVWRLTEKAWLDFQIEIDEHLYGKSLADTRALGVSIYDGIGEDTAVFQWFNAAKPTDGQLNVIREIYSRYGQECVAVTYAAPKFI